MYQEFFGLKTDPFRLSPDHRFCLRHATFEKARAYMQFAVHRAEGFVMVTGRPGTGKTTLIDDVLDEIDGQDVVAAKLVSAQLEAEDLLRMTAFNFGIPSTGISKSELLLEMQGFFANCIADNQRALLVIDEAQGLSVSALEELRLLTNLRINEQPMLQIFLVGQDGLRDLVLDPRMEQLHQRLIASCHLEPLDFKQTASYVMHRLKVAGWSGNPRLRAAAFPPLYRFSQGVPRRINLFMGRMLLHGWLEELTELGGNEANAIFEELKKEHLTPAQQENPLWDRPFTADPDELDESLLMPDQKIGAKLMEKRAKQQAAAAKPAAAPAPIPEEKPPAAAQPSPENTEPPKPTEIGQFLRSEKQSQRTPTQPSLSEPSLVKEKLTDPPEKAMAEPVLDLFKNKLIELKAHLRPPTKTAPENQPSGPRGGNLLGLFSSALVTAGVFTLALLITPTKGPSNGPWLKLWELARVDQARTLLHRWSNGSLPMAFKPKK